MLFNSETYLAFLALVVLVYWAWPRRWRPHFLLAASYAFYAYWSAPYLLLVVGLTAANYAIGLVAAARRGQRGLLVSAGVSVNLATLAVFKYLGLLDATAGSIAHHVGLSSPPLVHIVLPLGLSFFAFEFIHYQVELYRGRDPIRDPVVFALFPAFFPTQIAGPIKRYPDFVKQVNERASIDYPLVVDGIQLVIIGLFKKAIADSMTPVVSTVFGLPSVASGPDAWLGAIAFAVEIYLDFSGYTDIGRGSAQLLGYTVPLNFTQPYLATSLQDFWRRWHMSLSSWLRDYLYIPLGGSRGGTVRTRRNLMVTMALGGLWHGAGWHFLAWGVGHGTALIANSVLREDLSLSKRLPRWAVVAGGWLATQAAVLFLWVLFRAPSVGTAATLWRQMLLGRLRLTLLTPADAVHILLVAGLLIGIELAVVRWKPSRLFERGLAPVILRPAFITVLALVATYQSAMLSIPIRFIYFQF